MSNHVWCAAISFLPGNEEHPNERWSEPELVVVVYLRFGDAGGKEAAPIAIQMIKKWREICEKHGKSSHLTPSFSSEN